MCLAGGRCAVDPNAPVATASQPAPVGATGAAGSPELADACWARGAAVFGYISGALIPCDGGGALESVKPALEAAGRRALG